MTSWGEVWESARDSPSWALWCFTAALVQFTTMLTTGGVWFPVGYLPRQPKKNDSL